MISKTLNRLLPKSRNLRTFSAGGSNTREMIDSVSSTISGISQINYVEEFNPELSATDKEGLKQFLVYRSNPGDAEDEPKFMSYWVNLEECGPMYLDALIKIKDEMDPTLAFRR